MNSLPQEKLLPFVKSFKSVVLSTFSKDLEPLASYAPCVFLDQHIYIIISEAAPHFHNIKATNKAGLLFLEDEKDANSIFFRKRLSMIAEATFIEPSTMHEIFKNTHGDLVDMLLGKMDFSIVKFNIVSGTFVIGAGQAYKMNEQFELVDQDRGAKDRGHNK